MYGLSREEAVEAEGDHVYAERAGAERQAIMSLWDPEKQKGPSVPGFP